MLTNPEHANSADLLIIGGGVMGCATALFALQLDPTLRVRVLEPDPTYARASSALSAGSIRQQFSTPLNVQMSQFGLTYVSQPETLLAVPGEPPPTTGFIEGGYLFLATAAGMPVLEANHAVQRAQDAPVALLSPAQLQQRFAWLNVEGLAGASLGLAGEGWFDGYMYTRALRAKAQSLGAVFTTDRVVALEHEAGCIRHAVTHGGERMAAAAFVNAAGPWARSVAAMAGIELPVFARRRTVFALRCASVIGHTPLVIDTSGLWFRSEGHSGAQFIAGWGPNEDDDADDLPLEPELQAFEDHVWPTLAARVPVFEALRVEHAWAGYYEFNPIDHNALLGLHPACGNLYFINGFSGHGLQHAAAAGRGLAELIVHGAYRSLDLSPLSVARLVDGRRYIERNVI
jgi:FAD-dependent oxidoreductase domain-containing protein 1